MARLIQQLTEAKIRTLTEVGLYHDGAGVGPVRDWRVVECLTILRLRVMIMTFGKREPSRYIVANIEQDSLLSADVPWKLWTPVLIAVSFIGAVGFAYSHHATTVVAKHEKTLADYVRDAANDPCAWTAHTWIIDHYGLDYAKEHDGALPDPDIAMADDDNACKVVSKNGENASIDVTVAQGTARWTVELGMTRGPVDQYGIRYWKVTSFYEHSSRSISVRP